MDDQEFERIKELNERYSDLPDGAYFAIMAENGVETEDLAAFADECDNRGIYA